MKRVLAGTCLAAAFAVGLSAQTTPPQTTPPTQPPTSAAQERSSDAKNVTVTGCLKAGTSPDSFMLSDLKWGSGKSGGGAVGTSGSTGAPPAVASATSLKVTGGASAKLSEHVGHQVEVTGTIADKDDKAPTAKPTDPASARPSSDGPAIEARSVKMVSATCSTQ